MTETANFTKDTPKRVGLVLAGAVARGAYEAGVLSVLLPVLEARGERPRVLVGTSSGALNAAFLASRAHQSAREATDGLLDLWQKIGSHKVFRTFGPQWLKFHRRASGGLLDTRPLEDTIGVELDTRRIAKNIDEGHLDALAVVATAATTSRSTVFVQADDGHGFKLPSNDDRKGIVYEKPSQGIGVKHLMASAAVPILFPPVQVEEDGEWFVDGGLRLNTPIKPAIDLESERVVIVATNPALHPTIDAEGRPIAPDVDDSFLQFMQAAIADPLIEDMYRLARTNTLVNDGVAVADKEREIRPIPYLFVGPTERGVFGERAADVADSIDLPVDIDLSPSALVERLRAIFPPPPPDLPSVLVRLGMSRILGAQGPQQKELLSYVLFEPRFAKAAADLGQVDAHKELRAVAELSEPNQVEGWRIGPISSPPMTTTIDDLTDMALTHERFRRIIADNFGSAGITNPEELISRGASEGGRRRIARLTGLTEPTVLGWVHRADLMRVSGIGPEYAHLLVLAGVDTPEELGERKPASLIDAIAATNRQKNAVDRMPAESDVRVWIDRAGKLEAVVTE